MGKSVVELMLSIYEVLGKQCRKGRMEGGRRKEDIRK
jgi:hypothetical protein